MRECDVPNVTFTVSRKTKHGQYHVTCDPPTLSLCGPDLTITFTVETPGWEFLADGGITIKDDIDGEFGGWVRENKVLTCTDKNRTCRSYSYSVTLWNPTICRGATADPTINNQGDHKPV